MESGSCAVGLAAVVEAIPDAFVLLSPVRDEAGDVVDWVFAEGNARACSFNGVDRAGLVGIRLLDLHPSAEATGLLDAYRAVLATGEPLVLRDWAYPQDLLGGQVRRYDVYAARVGAGIGQVWRDVTEQREAEDRLERSEALLRVAMESEVDARFLADAVRDDAGRIVDFQVVMANESFAAQIGRRRDDAIGGCLRDLVGMEQSRGAIEAYRRVVETGTPHAADRTPTRQPDGTRHYADMRAVRVGDGVSVRWHDVTAIVQAEQAAALAREDYRLLAENAADLVARIAGDDQVVWVSPSSHRLLGYEPASLLGRQRLELLHPDDRSRAAAALAALRSGAALSVSEEVRLRHREGEYSWWQAEARRTSDHAASSDVVLTLRDIDAQVRERDRADAERTRRVAAVWSMLDPYLLVRAVRDPAGEVVDLAVLDANEAACTVLRHSVDRLVGARLGVLTPGLVGSSLFDLCMGALTSGKPVVADDVPYRAEGRTRSARIDARAVPIGDDRLSVTWRDVTERHEAAVALAASEGLFRSAMESASIGMCLVGPDGAFLRVNPALCDLLGRDAATLMTRTWQELTHPDDLAVDQALVDDVLAGRRESYRLRKRYLRPDGKVVHGDLSVGCVRDADGRVVYFVSQITDVTAEVRAEQEMREQRSLLQDTLDAEIDPRVRLVPVRDASGAVVDFVYAMANDAACRDHRVPREDLVGSRLLDLLPAHAESGLLDRYVQVLVSGEPLVLDDLTYPQESLGGEQRFYDVRVTRVGDGLSYVWRDVSDRHRAAAALAAAEEQFRTAMNAAPIGKAIAGPDGTIVQVNPAMCALLGRDETTLTGSSYLRFIDPDDLAASADALADVAAGRRDTARLRKRFLRPDGTVVHGDMAVSCVRHADGTPRALIVQVIDMTAEARATDALERLARTDTVTGLVNRHEALQRLELLLAGGRRPGDLFAVAFCDIDDFKAINDTHGHATGDMALRAVADRIRAALRSTDTVARFGGDEILALLPGVRDEETAIRIAEKIRHAASAPVTAPNGAAVEITLSIGVTIAAPDDTVDNLLTRADTAMYAAKNSGRNRTVHIRSASEQPTAGG